jgi:hypothetical protein
MSASATVGYSIGGYTFSGATLAAGAVALPAIALVAYAIHRSNQEGSVGEAALEALKADAARRIGELERQRRAQQEAVEATHSLRERARDLAALARAARKEAQRIEAEHPALAARLAALELPERCEDTSAAGLEAYIARVSPLIRTASEELGKASAAAAALFARKVAQASDAPQAPAPAGPPPADPQAAALLARIEARCTIAEAAELAPLMGALAVERNPARIAALSSELRAHEQELMERRARRERESAEARELVTKLPPVEGFELEKLHHQLLLVAAGEAELTERLRSSVRFALEESARAMREAQRELEALKAKEILESALQDLGYETEGISHTLFTEGGVAYFQGEAWGDYFVRLKVDPNQQAANFGLVRATGEPHAQRAVKDDLVMENEWCSASGRDQLLEVLRDRGMKVDLRKVFDIGALPVELVKEESVPKALRDKAAARRRAAGQARPAQRPKAMRQPPKKS